MQALQDTAVFPFDFAVCLWPYGCVSPVLNSFLFQVFLEMFTDKLRPIIGPLGQRKATKEEKLGKY